MPVTDLKRFVIDCRPVILSGTQGVLANIYGQSHCLSGNDTMRAFRRCVQHYRSHHKIKTFTCSDQFRCMAFAQLTYIDSFQTQQTNICHMSIHGGMSHKHPDQRQSDTRLANLCRLRPILDPYRSHTLLGPGFWYQTLQHRLRFRCHHYRPAHSRGRSVLCHPGNI